MERPLSPSSTRSPANSSFPTPLTTSHSQAPSIISSRMTDIASEDGDDFQSEGAGTGRRPTTAASSDPNRPVSTVSSQTRPSAYAPPSLRMGSPSTRGSWRTGGAFGGPGVPVLNTSRPASSSTTRTSRTHVPALAAQAFFRPMSSQRLQAQRGIRPSRAGQPPSSADGYSDVGTNTNRNSLVSETTPQQGYYHQQDSGKPPPSRASRASRGTEFTDQDDGGTFDVGPTENATVRSVEGSDRPLQHSIRNPRPMHLDLDQRRNESPKSFRANFRRKEAQGHERLSSSNNSPSFAKRPPEAPPKPGINYQYFSGNTIFCWGGRLQNTRDRPVNVASGIIVVLPAVLFLVYS